MSVTESYFSRVNYPKNSLHVFVCDSENYMEKLFGNYFLGKSHFSYTKIRARSTTTRHRNLQFRGAVSTGGSPLDFLLFLQFLCAIS